MRRVVFAATAIGLLIAGGAAVWIFSRHPSLEPSPATSPKPTVSSDPNTARVRVVGLDGSPLSGMLPIATETPNAFDAPVAKGKPTDSQGRGTVMLDPNRWLYVRAWDPQLRYFANNYFEVPAGNAAVRDELQIVMVEGATLKARLFRADGTPAAHENVGLMMFHPDKGPWWPGEADTDADGNVEFSRVPAGKFLLALKTAQSGRVDLPAVFLPPGGETHLGNVQLLPE